MSGVFDSVMTELAAGSSARTAARTLGISLDLAQAVAEQATRMGLVVSGGSACGTCVPATSPACAGCPFTDGSATKSSGVKSSGVKSSAVKSSGVKSSGVKSSGVKSSATDARDGRPRRADAGHPHGARPYSR